MNLLDLLMGGAQQQPSLPTRMSDSSKAGVSGNGVPTSAPSQLDGQGNVVVNAPPSGAHPMLSVPQQLMAASNSGTLNQKPGLPAVTPDQGPQITPASDQSSQPVMTNYNNLGDVQAAQKAVGQYNGVNLEANDPGRGLYGLLPQSMQHGTLRNVLGALGDAFLVHSGAQPEYRPRINSEQAGAALAGVDMNDPQSVQAAATRLASTGVPGATDMANKLIEQGEQAQLRKTQMDYNNIQRQQLNQYRDTGRLQQMIPTIGGMLKNVTDSASWAQAYDQIARRTAAIGNYKPEDLGLPPRDQYDPNTLAGFGMTANQQQVSGDKQRGQNMTQGNAAAHNATTIAAANINAGSRERAAKISASRPSEAEFLDGYEDKVNAGTNTPEDDARWHHDTDIPRGRRPAPGGAPSSAPVSVQNYGANNPVANGGKPITPQQANGLPKGTHFLGHDGSWYIR